MALTPEQIAEIVRMVSALEPLPGQPKVAVEPESEPQPVAGGSVFLVGEKYFIRCVTHYQLGRLKAITDNELVLEEASWIGDTGRFNEMLNTGKISENEPFYGDVIINRGAIVDAVLWDHDLMGAEKDIRPEEK